jgi:hypothetical protein
MTLCNDGRGMTLCKTTSCYLLNGHKLVLVHLHIAVDSQTEVRLELSQDSLDKGLLVIEPIIAN